nr:conjugative transfer relaxase/helicase TraI domain-containing protein [Escherichia coli]
MKQHVQVYTDNRQGWTDAINNAVQKGTAHDVLEPKPDREVMNAERLFSTARELRDRRLYPLPLRPESVPVPARWNSVTVT